MLFALIALLYALMKWFEIDPVAAWSWWWIAVPVGLAVIWWEVLDPALGISKRRESAKMEQRKVERHRRMQKELGQIEVKRKKRN